MKFIVDTNVLLSYPKVLDEGELVITRRSLKEIDGLKKSPDSELRFNCRRASHAINEKRDNIQFIMKQKMKLCVDDEIIYFAKKYGYGIITNDLNILIVAYKMGIPCHGYSNEGNHYSGVQTICAKFDSLNYNDTVNTIVTTKQPPMPMKENEFLIIKNEDSGEVYCSYRYINGELILLGAKRPITNSYTKKILPRNPEQECLFNLLQDESVKIVMAKGKYGSGKAQPNTTRIPTPNGYKLMGELNIGDFVFDRFGKPTKVLGVYPQGIIDNYKVIFSDGRVSYCNDEHIWSCYTSKGNLKDFTLKEILKLGIKTNSGANRFYLPCAEPVQYNKKEFLVDPYVIGAFLGDGCCLEPQLTLSSQDEEIVAEVSKLIGAKNYNRQSDENYSWHFSLPVEGNYETKILTKDLFKNIDGIREYSYNKYIPEEYKYGSVSQRFSLLQGLLDTDGSIDDKGRIRFTTTSLKLAKDVQELSWSLGMRATIGEDHRGDKYTTGACYNVQIMCENKNKKNLFRLTRKLNIALSAPETTYSRKNKIAIVDIIKEEPVEMTCIYVDNSEHLYLTEQFIVTHNTMCLTNYALEQLEKGKIDKIVWVPNNAFNDNSREIAALPGTLFEKELPFIGSLIDIIGETEAERLLSNGLLEIVPISIMRGRNFKNCIILVNEAQNLTEEHIKLLVGRCAEGSRIFFDGDIKQVDSYVFKNKNGLKLLLNLADSEKFSKIFGVVTLNTIERSLVAQASDYLDNI